MERARSVGNMGRYGIAIAVTLLWAGGARGDCDGDGYPNFVDPTPCGFDGADGREASMSAALHLHGSISEGDGTIYANDHWASTYGVDVLYWSDHDSMQWMYDRPQTLDFDNGTLLDTYTNFAGEILVHGFDHVTAVGDEVISEVVTEGLGGSDHHLHQEVQSDFSGAWASSVHEYVGGSSSTQMALLARGRLELDLRPLQALNPNWQFVISVELSANLGGTRNTLHYYMGTHDLSQFSDDDDLYVPILVPEDSWSTVTLPLSVHANYFPEQQDQNARGYSITLRSRNGERAEFDLDNWHRSWDHEGEALRQQHRDWIDQHYANSPVTHYVGTEMTPIQDARHVCPLGEGIPLLPYTSVIQVVNAVAFVHGNGGVAICAHPFGTTREVLYEDQLAEPLVMLEKSRWVHAGGFGCDAVEVGYPMRVLGTDDYLWFWDELGLAGLMVTGVGSSDNHWSHDWATDPNNWVTWVFLDVPSEDGIADAVLRGRAFFGNPIPFAGEEALLDIWSEHGVRMGQAVRTALDHVIHVETGYLAPGWSLALVVAGQVFDEVLLDGSETDTVFDLPRENHKVVRAEVRDENGDPLLVSNPIYLLTPYYPGSIPQERQVQ